MFSVPRTPFDFEFTIFNVPVVVNGTFWITAALLSWQISDGDPSRLLMAMICIFISLLTHELGHALANMAYGYTSQIVLYDLGGFATGNHMPQLKRLVVVLAGPCAGFTLLLITYLTTRILVSQGIEIHPLLGFGISILFYVNLVWNVLNLLPLFPLDGGQAVQALFLYFEPRRGAVYAALSSFLFAIPILIAAIQFQFPFVAVYAALFGYQSFQEYQDRQRRGF